MHALDQTVVRSGQRVKETKVKATDSKHLPAEHQVTNSTNRVYLSQSLHFLHLLFSYGTFPIESVVITNCEPLAT